MLLSLWSATAAFATGFFGVGIGDGHKITAYNGFTLAVRGAAVVDFLDLCRFQLLAAVLALLVLAARSVGVGSLSMIQSPGL